MKNFHFELTTIEEVKAGIVKLTGENVFVGKDEKAKNHTIAMVTIDDVTTNYRLFYKGTMDAFINVLGRVNRLVNGMGSEIDYICIAKTLWIVDHKSTEKQHSKLDGIKSLSTSCLNNAFCQQRMKCKDSICSHCYAASQQRNFGLTDHNVINGFILQNIAFYPALFQIAFPALALEKVFRIESFGDVANRKQIYNYLSLCNAFPMVNFAAWSKNVALWESVFRIVGKPANLSFIASANKVNDPNSIPCANSEYIDHTFTVYDRQEIDSKGIKINCGGRACAACIAAGKNCYYRNADREIREELK